MDFSRRIVTGCCLLAAVASVAVSLSAQDTDAPASLIRAIQRGDTAAVSRLLASGVDPNVKDKDGVPAVMLAALFAETSCVEQLLKGGADPNQTDTTGATALMWAIPDRQKVRVLVERGANVNAQATSSGRTPLLIAAGYPGTVDLIELLLGRGADLRAKDASGFTALALAMLSADVDVLRFLVGRGLDPLADMPPPAQAAVFTRARPAVVDYVMGHGFRIPKDLLLRASNWQRPELIKRWIEQGADTNARGGLYGLTPLLTASASEYAGAETLRVLLDHGADPNVQDSEGEKPLDWAVYRNDKARIALLEARGATRGQGPRRQDVPLAAGGGIGNARVSVERSTSLLLKSSSGIFEGRRCYTCHHNTVPAEAAALARRKGIPIPEDLAKKNVQDIYAVLRQAAAPAMQGQSTVPGRVAITVGYGLMALAAERHPADTVTAAMTHWMLATQMPDGSWLGNGVNRPPIESSTISHTAIAVRGLTLYPIASRTPQIDRALANAREWLLSADAPNAEDRAMRLLGLVWTKAPASAVNAAVHEIVRRQAPSGGWSQLDALEADAYATGLSLVALHQAGMAVTDDAYRSGVAFLLRTQYPDGSWLVRTRAFPVQPYFESGFPFGRHQWISAAGTAWAAQAIALTLPDSDRSARRD